MESIRELLSVIDRYSIKNIDMLEKPGTPEQPNRYLQLVEGVRRGKFRNDKAATEALYDGSNAESNFRVLKTRLKDHLFGLLFFLELKRPNHSEFQLRFYQCHRELFCAKFLIAASARRTGLNLARSAYRKARKFEIHDVALTAARLLRRQYSWVGDAPNFEAYDKIIAELSEIVSAESRAEGLQDRLVMKTNASTAHSPKLRDLAADSLKELTELRRRMPTYTIQKNYLHTRLIERQLHQDYHAALEVCIEAEAFLKKNPHLSSPKRLSDWYSQRMLCYLALREYDRGIELAETAISVRREGSVNWFISLEVYFLLCMHSGRFGLAAIAFDKVVSDRRYATLPQYLLEKWKLYERYLRHVFVTHWGDAHRDEVPEALMRRLWRKVQPMVSPLFSRDKEGYNKSVLTIQILELLSEGRIDEISDKMEALARYTRRYLNVQDYRRRGGIFFRMLALMESRSFDPQKTRKAAAKWYAKLEENLQTAEVDGIEIVPYEMIWQRILVLLEEYQQRHI